MSGTSLQDFVCRALEHKRISFGDLRRLQRDILPDRITTREEAEILLALDGSVDSADRSWRDYLVRAVRDFVIWGSPPAGHIDGDKAQWMMTALSSSSAKTARAITREIVREGPVFDDDLRAVAASSQPHACKKRTDRRAGWLRFGGGKLKEGAGKATGDQKLRAEGIFDQIKGRFQNAIGGIKDALRRK